MKRLIIILLLLSPLMLESRAKPAGELLNRYLDESSAQEEYLCGFHLEGVDYLTKEQLIPILDSLCRNSNCSFCTFHDSKFHARYPAYEGANDHYIGAYDVNTQVYLPPEKSTLSQIPVPIWIVLGATVLLMIVIWLNRYKTPASQQNS